MKFPRLNWKIWILIIAIIASLIAIFPFNFTQGVQVVSVTQNTTAYAQGIGSGEIITSIDGKPITSVQDYNTLLNSLFPSKENIKLTITTNKNDYILYTNNFPNISVANIERTRLKTG